jgi:GTP-binding protein Era
VSHRAGFVAIVGRPNVGKSTLLNALIGARVAAVSPKPQTTRNRIVGIRTLPEAQAVFLDTPGIHAARSFLNRRLVETAERALGEADVVVLVVDAAAGIGAGDRDLAATLAATGRPVTVALNKRDRVRPPRLLPLMAELGGLLPGRDLVPVSARTGEGIETLLASVVAALPEGPRLHPEDEFTTETERFIAQEMVREQLFRQTEEEVPYGIAVEIEEFRDARAAEGDPAQRAGSGEKGLVFIRAVIVVERETHKGIVIGAGGARLKDVGRQARLALESLLDTKVFLELFVRVEPGWTGNARRMKELGL